MTTQPPVVSRAEWLAARRQLLEQEKELTRRRDALAAARRALPMVALADDHRLTGPEGSVGLRELFGLHRQLIIYHFMFDPAWDEGCPSCSYFADNFTGPLTHLPARDTAFAAVSRAPLPQLLAFRAHFLWYSSHGSDFNTDFAVSVDATDPDSTYNYRPTTDQLAAGTIWVQRGELPGLSVFLRQDRRIFHTYSTYARGLDHLITPTTTSTSPRTAAATTTKSPIRWPGSATTTATGTPRRPPRPGPTPGNSHVTVTDRAATNRVPAGGSPAGRGKRLPSRWVGAKRRGWR